MKSSSPLVGAALVAAIVAVGHPGSAQADAQEVAARLGNTIHAGSVDADDGVGFGRAVGVVDAPFDRVLATVRNYASYSEFLPHFRESRVLSRRGDDAMVYLEASVVRNTVTLWANMRIRSLPNQGEAHVIEGRMTQGNMEQFTARWEVSPLDDGRRALVSFQILVDPDLPMPSSIFTRENVKSARRTIEALRRRVD
jgi:ribosome-associated toxin RatA of RatAB toxin-antitoxin module